MDAEYAITEAISKLALDESRDLLYALTSNNIINLYNVSGQATAPLQRVAIASNIFKQAQLLCPPLGTAKLDILDIHAFTASDSSSIHLMAVTSSGIRFYFTALRRNFSNYGTSTSVVSGGPSTLELVHVRMVPSSVEYPRSTHYDQDTLYRGPSNSSIIHSKSWQPSKLSLASYLEACSWAPNPLRTLLGQCKHLNSELGAQTALHLSVSR